jgi:hypothetical protein
MMNGRRLRTLILLALCASFAGVTGCSPESNESVVDGTVTLDGKPLSAGLIRFEPADGKSATSDAMISDGKYSAKVPPGNKRVSITSTKVVGKKSMYEAGTGPTVEAVREAVPPQYNTHTELTYTVAPGAQSKSFDLKSK